MSLSHNCNQSQQKNFRLRVAVSACLVGQAVRYDGGHKKHGFVHSVLAPMIELVPICPEVEIGMGVPRPTIHVVEQSGTLKALGVENPGLDVTRELNQFGRSSARRLHDIDGYIFKARSPSCGVNSTVISLGHGKHKTGAGLFAAQIMRNMPLLPVVEEAGLETNEMQVNFIQRLEAYHRLQGLNEQRPAIQRLLAFHHSNRLELMAHGATGLRQLEHWLDSLAAGGRLAGTHQQEYGRRFMNQMSKQASRRRHMITLRHVAARWRKYLEKAQHEQLSAQINLFGAGQLSLGQVKTELRRLAQHEPLVELAPQSYLQRSLAERIEQ